MNFYVLTLFPDMIMDGLRTSITGRAMEAGLIHIEAVNIRDFTKDKHKHVDDYPYGGGAGMVMQAEPVYNAYQYLCEKTGKKLKVVYMTPQGRTFTQKVAEEFAVEDDLVLLCGHYEGIDERVLELIVTDYVSIGDFVLTGGELPAMVLMDAVIRQLPGAIKDLSASDESFSTGLLDAPHYTRPEVWRDMPVPEVLLSGHHKNIRAWTRKQALQITAQTRPDLVKISRSKNLLTREDERVLRDIKESTES